MHAVERITLISIHAKAKNLKSLFVLFESLPKPNTDVHMCFVVATVLEYRVLAPLGNVL